MTTRIPLLPLIAAAGLVMPAGTAQAQNEFHWKGTLAAGKTIEIRGINGDVRATAGSGAVEVSALKSAHRSDPDEVKIQVVEHPDGVTICAVYPSDGRRENECHPGGDHSSTRNNDVRVDFTVRVPAGVRFSGNTVNGAVDAEQLGSDVEARTVNGAIRISTSGEAEATTVNGSIVAAMGRSSSSAGLEFTTVNGGITLELPATLAADLRASTVNGDIETDFPLTVMGKFGRHSVRGTIGGGGRQLALTTVNGSIRLHKAGI